MTDSRGYYGIGIVGSKTPLNVGTLWRSAYTFGAAFIFTTGYRYPRQAADTLKAYRHIPLYHHATVDDLWESIPYDCVPVAVEIDGRARPIGNYVHPERAVYLLGAEDHGLPNAVLDRVRDVIVLPGTQCLNVAVAGSVVMYDRVTKRAPATPLTGPVLAAVS